MLKILKGKRSKRKHSQILRSFQCRSQRALESGESCYYYYYYLEKLLFLLVSTIIMPSKKKKKKSLAHEQTNNRVH